MAKKQRTPRRSPRRPKALLEAVFSGGVELEKLPDALNIKLEQLADRACDERLLARLRSLRVLADIQTQMLISRWRLSAAARLIALATQEENGELSRKASVDLLRLDLPAAEPETPADAGPPAPATIDPARENQLRMTLQNFGETGEAA